MVEFEPPRRVDDEDSQAKKKIIGTVHYLTLMSMCKTGISIS